MNVRAVRGDLREEGWQEVTLLSGRARIAARFTPVAGARSAVLYAGGVGGGFDTPARDLYPRLCRELRGEGLAGLQVAYRNSVRLDTSVFDVRAGLEFLRGEGAAALGLVGHSFGGAVVIQAAARTEGVRTVVTLATQSFGTGGVAGFRPGLSILLIHGADDRALPPICSSAVYASAHDPRVLWIVPGATHMLEEASEQVHDRVRRWLLEKLPH